MKGNILKAAAGVSLLAIGVATALTVTLDAKSPEPGEARPAGCERVGNTFYEENPVYRDPRPTEWRRGSPEDQGLNPLRLNQGAAEVSRNDSALSLLVVRHGELVMERYFHGVGRQDSANIHSASKSILRILLGIAIDAGYRVHGRPLTLDTRVAEVLPEYFSDDEPGKRDITLRHLVEMSAGLEWSEDETEEQIQTRPDWTAAILDRELETERPGQRFLYSTGLTHVLATVLTRVTGQSLWDFARARLFGPLGITPEHWGRDPQGICSGGYNLYLTPREMARFGQLLLRDGVWNGRRIVSASTIAEARRKVWRDPEEANWYGQLFRVNTIKGVEVFYAEGHGGQFIYLLPDMDTVLVLTAATAAPYGDDYYDANLYARRWLIPAITDRT
ncbi:serine hydrolase domain-containing protein [Actinomadura syzygii]|uniref:Serine hydrolase n=1 Tax=Actinomadura syzygii TaxID=1427538 RepID=A0A5D0U1S5_9ACTN|nr:serine hydrolase [Actinomadura syzygii]TYC11542.1 serine hydrolase [Actinomadura syzygii]